MSVEKEWAAVDDETVVERADTKTALHTVLRQQGLTPDDYEIMALPKAHGSFLL